MDRATVKDRSSDLTVTDRRPDRRSSAQVASAAGKHELTPRNDILLAY